MTSKILIVDDNFLIAMNLSDTLKELGFSTCEAHSADQAAELVRTDASISMIFTDLHMPGTNGYQLADKVRLMRPELPVVLVTGDESAITSDHGLQVLSKPYTCQDLHVFLGQAGTYLH